MNSENSRHFYRARVTALVLLFFLGLSALSPAIIMIVNPSGSPMGLCAEVGMGIFYGMLTIPLYLVAITLLVCGAWMAQIKTGLS